MKSTILKSKDIISSLRIDGSYHLSEAVLFEKCITKRDFKPLSEFSLRIFTAGRNKRNYTLKDYGYPYLSNSEVIAQNPFSNCKYNSKKYGYDINALLMKGMIVTGRVGAIGQTAFITKEFEEKHAMGSDNIIRIVPKDVNVNGFLFAYLTSMIGNAFLWKHATGGVQPYINEAMVGLIPVPIFSTIKQRQIQDLITDTSDLRVQANKLLEEAEMILKRNAGLRNLNSEDYDYYGPHSINRKVSCFTKNISNIGTISINAFNHSKRISNTVKSVNICCKTLKLYDVLDDNKFFTTGSFPRIEVHSDKGIMLINQSDIFDTMIKGKKISRRKVKVDNLVQYGEVLIAGVGTLGDNELFCRVVFANEGLQGQLVSGEFIRMKTNESIPPGYLFTWLNSDYGFRFIRSTQSGTKQCRPIHKLLMEIPIPILENEIMFEIHNIVKKAHSLRYKASLKENQAIQLVEKEIEQWQQ